MIDPETLQHFEITCSNGNKYLLLPYEHLADVPTVEIDPESLRPKGKWRLNRDGSGTCSECNRTRNDVWDMDDWDNFCSHCGADMREG